MLTIGSFLLTIELLCLQLVLGAPLLRVRASWLTIGVMFRIEVCLLAMVICVLDCKEKSTVSHKEVQL